jgi:hypothetical protein
MKTTGRNQGGAFNGFLPCIELSAKPTRLTASTISRNNVNELSTVGEEN